LPFVPTITGTKCPKCGEPSKNTFCRMRATSPTSAARMVRTCTCDA
jgi:hypothetical protein